MYKKNEIEELRKKIDEMLAKKYTIQEVPVIAGMIEILKYMECNQSGYFHD